MEAHSYAPENGQALSPRPSACAFRHAILEVVRASKTLENFKTLFDRYPNYQLDASLLEFQYKLGGRFPWGFAKVAGPCFGICWATCVRTIVAKTPCRKITDTV